MVKISVPRYWDTPGGPQGGEADRSQLDAGPAEPCI